MKLARAPLRRARVEIIPMIDTVFFLLVFFMMASLSMSMYRAMPVSLPQAATGRPPAAESVDITITPGGEIAVNREPIALDALEETLRERAATVPDLAVVIHADQAVTHGRVVDVLDAVRAAGVSRLAIATMPKGTPARP